MLPARTTASGPQRSGYRDFSSDELNTFVDLAIKNNGDLAIARARVTQADARARQAGSAILPSVDGAGNANYLAGHSSQGGGHELDWSAMLTCELRSGLLGKEPSRRELRGIFGGRVARGARRSRPYHTGRALPTDISQVLALRERLAIAQSNRDAAQQLLTVGTGSIRRGVRQPRRSGDPEDRIRHRADCNH